MFDHLKSVVRRYSAHILVGLIVAMMLVPQAFTFASVAITIDTDVLFTSVNDWISTFIAPLSIGIGIAIALSLITFIGAQIIGAFRGQVRR
jgi:uncharacterized protein involved in cysteine biosynthesis